MGSSEEQSIGIQVAVLTEQLTQYIQSQKEHHNMERIEREIVLSKLDKLSTEVTHYKGMAGGVMLMFSTIGAFLILLKGFFFPGKSG